jgi:hypothetical protein
VEGAPAQNNRKKRKILSLTVDKMSATVSGAHTEDSPLVPLPGIGSLLDQLDKRVMVTRIMQHQIAAVSRQKRSNCSCGDDVVFMILSWLTALYVRLCCVRLS